MDWREFAASTIDSLAWPLSMVGLAVLFRKEAAAWTTRLVESGSLKSLKAGPVALEFYETLRQAEEDIEAARASEPEPPAPNPAAGAKSTTQEQNPSPRFVPTVSDEKDLFVGDLREVARISAPAAVVEGFARLEATLNQSLNQRLEPAPRRRLPARRLAGLGAEQGLLSPWIAAAVADLSHLRNLAAHGEAGRIDLSQANQYLDLVNDVISHVNTWIKADADR